LRGGGNKHQDLNGRAVPRTEGLIEMAGDEGKQS